MTIAIASICTDGLVVCADTQVTHLSGYKSHEKKISVIELPAKRGNLVLAYAGVPQDMRTVVERLQDQIGQAGENFDIRATLQLTLDETLKKSKAHQMLCAFCDAGDLRLVRSDGTKISPVPVWDCVGYGDSALTKYLGGIFLSDDVLPLRRAVPICIYLIAQTKKYVDWCGGDTDIAVLNPDGTATELPLGTRYDAVCSMIEKWLNGILTSTTEPNVSGEKIQELIMALRNVMNEQIGAITAFLSTNDCVGCGKQNVSTEPKAKFCSACKRWVCASCVEAHFNIHVSEKAAKPLL